MHTNTDNQAMENIDLILFKNNVMENIYLIFLFENNTHTCISHKCYKSHFFFIMNKTYIYFCINGGSEQNPIISQSQFLYR